MGHPGNGDAKFSCLKLSAEWAVIPDSGTPGVGFLVKIKPPIRRFIPPNPQDGKD